MNAIAQKTFQEKIKNPYIPMPMTIRKIIIENEIRDLKTFELEFCNGEDVNQFKFNCGQFAMLSVSGAGESPLGIASSPLDEGFIQFTVKKYPTGIVTTALHNMEEGDEVGLRGPYGNSYPLKEMEGKNILIIGGGFALTTLRSTIRYMLDKEKRSRFKKITVIYGARSPGELIYKSELREWEDRDDIDVYITVDKRDENWKGREGFIPEVLREVAPNSENAMTLVCGPPVMLYFTFLPLLDLGFAQESIITSLERRMSCGIGKCGRCNIGSKYVCKDGPVFTFKQIKELPEELF